MRILLTSDPVLKIKMSSLGHSLKVDTWLATQLNELADAVNQDAHAGIAIDLDTMDIDARQLERHLTPVRDRIDIVLVARDTKGAREGYLKNLPIISRSEFESNLTRWFARSGYFHESKDKFELSTLGAVF